MMDIHVPAEPFHPGEYVADELKARQMTQADLAAITGISRRQIINLIQGKSGITADTAIKLAAAFGDGHDAMGWMNLQSAYELALAAQETRKQSKIAKVYSRVPVREITRRGWIPATKDIKVLEQSVCNLLQKETLDDFSIPAIAARKSTSYSEETGAQLAWYGRSRQLAEAAPAATYSVASLDAGLKELRALLAYPEDARRVPSVLASMGIRLVFNKHLQRTKVDGVAFWLDERSPAIAMSLRFDRIDYFWFTLLHEIWHIKNNDKGAPVDSDNTSPASDGLPEFEVLANEGAANYLIPEDKMASFIQRTKPFYYESKVVQFAQARGVHPAIVVGQLAKRPDSGFEYKQLRKLHVNIREHLIGAAVTDGWGNEPRI